MTQQESLQALRAEIAQLKAEKLEVDMIEEAKLEIAELKAADSNAKAAAPGKQLSKGNVAMLIGMGVCLAPFTGGGSLGYAAVHIASLAAVDSFSSKK